MNIKRVLYIIIFSLMFSFVYGVEMKYPVLNGSFKGIPGSAHGEQRADVGKIKKSSNAKIIKNQIAEKKRETKNFSTNIIYTNGIYISNMSMIKSISVSKDFTNKNELGHIIKKLKNKSVSEKAKKEGFDNKLYKVSNDGKYFAEIWCTPYVWEGTPKGKYIRLYDKKGELIQKEIELPEPFLIDLPIHVYLISDKKLLADDDKGNILFVDFEKRKSHIIRFENEVKRVGDVVGVYGDVQYGVSKNGTIIIWMGGLLGKKGYKSILVLLDENGKLLRKRLLKKNSGKIVVSKNGEYFVLPYCGEFNIKGEKVGDIQFGNIGIFIDNHKYLGTMMHTLDEKDEKIIYYDLKTKKILSIKILFSNYFENGISGLFKIFKIKSHDYYLIYGFIYGFKILHVYITPDNKIKILNISTVFISEDGYTEIKYNLNNNILLIGSKKREKTIKLELR
ncbi:MAG: hypothetical protein GXO93_05725 [FCB group bacterium]|nr:hypothetical protein [FCB group bacterium]